MNDCKGYRISAEADKTQGQLLINSNIKNYCVYYICVIKWRCNEYTKGFSYIKGIPR